MPRSITQTRCALPYWASILKEGAQCRLVGGVARQDLVGERKTIRRDDQRDDHLDAVAALVAAVAVAALVGLVLGRIGLEVAQLAHFVIARGSQFVAVAVTDQWLAGGERVRFRV